MQYVFYKIKKYQHLIKLEHYFKILSSHNQIIITYNILNKCNVIDELNYEFFVQYSFNKFIYI